MDRIQEAIGILGELFIIGFKGVELTEETAAFLTQASIGGVILFSSNYEAPSQVAKLINQIQDSQSGLPLWISVDHEGGRVQRFKKGFTRIPDAASIGASQSPQLAFEIAEVMAKELKAVGINLNFTPVADIATNSQNPVIGTRAFGATESIVSQMSSATIRGHLVNGVQPCLKHFPGHGDTSTDSHFALPRVDTPLDILQVREFLPFLKGIKAKCSMIMTAHVIVAQLDPKFPATLSTKVIRDLLRTELNYQKIIISDDLEMKAITDHFGAEEAPKLALAAGCDLLIYRSEEAARHAYTALKQALIEEKLDPDLVLTAAHRSRALKTQVLLPYQVVNPEQVSTQIGIAAHQAVIAKLSAQNEFEYNPSKNIY